jgi:arginine decarboxylase
MRKWRIEDSAELYNINGWGIDYFSINDKGNVVVTPSKNGVQVDLRELIDELIIRDVSTPLLLRFPDIIHHRIETIFNCFQVAAKEYEYKGKSFIIYPIKVNQMRPVVEEIVKYGAEFNIGLEAGSKPELHAVLAIQDSPEALVICNGYKDEAFIELALLAQKMGKNVFLVVEKLNELKLIIKISKKLNVKPNIGIRVKLASAGSGKWESSGGDRSKFGLNASELLEATSILENAGRMDELRLIHFHLGSQITKIGKIKTALREASQFYVQLRKQGFNVEFVDIGGGLGVDYDGSRSTSQSSINYSIQEYVNDAVSNIVDVCDKNDLPHPNIITESGRSITAHHSVLVFDVLETTSLPTWDNSYQISEDDDELILELHNIYSRLTKNRMIEAWHDALQIREESLDRFSLGMLDLKTRALIERLFWTVARDIHEIAQDMKHNSEELRVLARMLSDKYFCNFSLFQSLPDSWAIDQIFPIIPIHRLGEKPTKVATIQDITCDSDGKIDHFIGTGDFSYNMQLHQLRKNEPYYIGVFLVGAYQEILGDLHNLFGDTNAVHIAVDDNKYMIKQIIDGETVEEVLDYVQFNSKKLVRTMETWVSTAVKEGKITATEGKEFLANYRSGLYGYTYLQSE